MSFGTSAGSFSTQGDIGQSSFKDYEFAQKKYGKDGIQTQIYANFFPLQVNTRKIYHYDIDISPTDTIKEQGDRNVPQRNRLLQQKKLFKHCNFEVFERFVKQETALFSSKPIFDGRKNVYS